MFLGKNHNKRSTPANRVKNMAGHGRNDRKQGQGIRRPSLKRDGRTVKCQRQAIRARDPPAGVVHRVAKATRTRANETHKRGNKLLKLPPTLRIHFRLHGQRGQHGHGSRRRHRRPAASADTGRTARIVSLPVPVLRARGS